ncbi:nucleotidyl transferase AbiEii/AbiGii toxin family protein [Polyangium aurulentum]|uniref:nucleotidyl transferase AbiEii/AbiGii toxin family protein n=1 Tax=Polyangium aurulentum TaxID=2567896 RepID=UPI0010AEE3D9|nr:nucleotidyl transferase AbiEii/AbiGii toxin family protein [Polyangium aurulentum]UQA56578.1 nucleotidyl transferase AbiEii/AbiGii toxin family protein [Polyangium aurulentum]
MSTSDPARLPDFLERIVLAAQDASPALRLVGGTGLALLLGHRRSDDLDLFCGVREDIEPVVRAVEHACEALGTTAHRVRSGPGFVRLEVPHEEGPLRVDVASDTAPRLVEEQTLVGPVRVESLRDQRANKIVALLGRSELRDLVDLYFIDRAGMPVLEGFEDAVRKDGGMDPAWFAWAVSQIEPQALRGMIAPLDLEALRRFRDELQRGALDKAGARQT